MGNITRLKKRVCQRDKCRESVKRRSVAIFVSFASFVFVVSLLVPNHVNGSAQSSTATLHGFIVDEQGAVISGVQITLLNKNKALSRQVTTGDEGSFTFALLPPDSYLIRAQRDGFSPVEIENVTLNINDQRVIKIQLKVGGIGDIVNITDYMGLQDTATVGVVIDRKFIENIPLNGRNFQSLITLAPGVVLTKATTAEQGQFSVNGQRANTNYFTIDGVSANTGINPNFNLGQLGSGSLPGLNVTGGTGNLVSIDALQEFKIQTANYSPEFGRTPGGQIALLTRSGSSQFHGSVFSYLRNDLLDANDWFANRDALGKPALRQNDFGGTAGGPLSFPRSGQNSPTGDDWRHRTFFFFSYEGLRLRQPAVGSAIVPSIAARQMASASIRPILDAYPVPNREDLGDGLARFSAGYSDPTNLDTFSLRIDRTPHERRTWFARYSYAPSSIAQRMASLSQSSRIEINHHTFTFGLTQTLAAGINNDLRTNYTEFAGSSFYQLDNFGGAAPPSASAVFPSFASPQDSLTFFQVNGADSLAVGKIVDNVQRQINVIDNLSIVAGSHQFKAGLDYRRLSPINRPRTYEQIVRFTGVAGPLEDPAPAGTLISGRASSIQITAREPVPLLFSNFSLYGQDTWRVKPRLTLTYGLRWELNPPPEARGGKDLFTVTGLNDPASIDLAERGTPLWETGYLNLAPRIGLAYQLSQKQGWETMLRGGFGIFYDLGSGVVADNASTYPYSRGKSAFSSKGIPYPLDPSLALPPAFSITPPYGSFYVFDPDLSLPRTYQQSVTLEQALGPNQTLSISYVGAEGRRLLRQEFLQDFNDNFPFGLFVTRNTATSDYHALQLQFQRRFVHGLMIMGSYTWSHSIDIASNDSAPNTPSQKLDPRIDRGPSDFDVRHLWSGAMSYDIPARIKGSAIADEILRNWAFDAIFRARTATPIDITYTRDIGFGRYSFRPDLVLGVPIYIDDPTAPGGKRINNEEVEVPGNPYPQIGPFLRPAENRQGTLGRNVLRGFPFWQVDFAVRRQFDLAEGIHLQFKAEFFNLFNHPNFADPRTSLTDPLFGVSGWMLNKGLGTAGINGGLNPVYQVGGPRSIQMVIKLAF